MIVPAHKAGCINCSKLGIEAQKRNEILEFLAEEENELGTFHARVR